MATAVAVASASFNEVRASEAEHSAADEGLGLAKRAYLPDADLYFQWNRATRNNVFGLLLPGGVPSISGPVLQETTSQGAFGSVAAGLVRWEAFDFGSRAASVREAEALRRRAGAGRRLTGLDASLGAVDAFLGVVAGDSAAAAVERMEVLHRGRRGSGRERAPSRRGPVARPGGAGAGAKRARSCRGGSGAGAGQPRLVARPGGGARRGRRLGAHREPSRGR